MLRLLHLSFIIYLLNFTKGSEFKKVKRQEDSTTSISNIEGIAEEDAKPKENVVKSPGVDILSDRDPASEAPYDYGTNELPTTISNIESSNYQAEEDPKAKKNDDKPPRADILSDRDPASEDPYNFGTTESPTTISNKKSNNYQYEEDRKPKKHGGKPPRVDIPSNREPASEVPPGYGTNESPTTISNIKSNNYQYEEDPKPKKHGGKPPRVDILSNRDPASEVPHGYGTNESPTTISNIKSNNYQYEEDPKPKKHGGKPPRVDILSDIVNPQSVPPKGGNGDYSGGEIAPSSASGGGGTAPSSSIDGGGIASGSSSAGGGTAPGSSSGGGGNLGWWWWAAQQNAQSRLTELPPTRNDPKNVGSQSVKPADRIMNNQLANPVGK